MAIRQVISRSIGVDVIAAEDIAANAITAAEIQDGVIGGAELTTPFNYQSGLLYLDSTNNRVIVGATSANEKFKVVGNIEIYNDDTDGYIWFHDVGTRSWTIGSDQSTGNFSITSQSDLLANERFSINPNGFVSIGTSSGNEKLNVQGAIGSSAASANFNAGDERIIIDYTGSVARVGHVNGASGSAKPLEFLTAGQTRMTLSSGGFLGIGEPNPTSPLHVATSSAQRVATFISTSSDPQIYLGDAASSDNAIILGYDRADNRGYLTVAGDGDNVFTITNGGNIGIGISNPSVAKLQVYNSSVLNAQICNTTVGGHYFDCQSADGENGFTIYQRHGSTSSRHAFIVKDNISTGRTAFAVRSDGNVFFGGSNSTNTTTVGSFINSLNGGGKFSGIWTNPSDGPQFSMCNLTTNINSGFRHISFRSGSSANENGAIYNNGSNVSYSTSSDYRLKENDVDIEDGIDLIKSLRPIRYNWINNPEETVMGFFAHEVSEAGIPQAVRRDKDEVDEDGEIVPQQLDQSQLVPVLTAALKSAIARIEELETRLTDAGL